MKLSIVVPLFNESESLIQLCREIITACYENDVSFEVIFVNDGSTDCSWAVVKERGQLDERITGIRFRRNFGKAAALTAGMRAADGHLISMDLDECALQPGRAQRSTDSACGKGEDITRGRLRH